ncbi:hypothetical protein EVA_08976 [gut metagenome]|uniref:Uncharacterized protein n=1 Tax=gut metagenome TaxID=749906 RepID=J9G6N7_9ZZZZ
MAGRGTGCNHNCACKNPAFIGGDFFGVGDKIYTVCTGIHGFNAQIFRLYLHLLCQLKAADTVFKTGIIFDFTGGGKLTAW